MRTVLNILKTFFTLLFGYFKEIEVTRVVVGTYKTVPATVVIALVMTWIVTEPFTLVYGLYAVAVGLLFGLLYELANDFYRYLVIYERHLNKTARRFNYEADRYFESIEAELV